MPFLKMPQNGAYTKAGQFSQFREAFKNWSSELFFAISGVVNRHFYKQLVVL
jgi:hypothetical protein